MFTSIKFNYAHSIIDGICSSLKARLSNIKLFTSIKFNCEHSKIDDIRLSNIKL